MQEAGSKQRDVPPKLRLTFDGLHGVRSQKMELFVTTYVRAANIVYGNMLLMKIIIL